MIKFMNMEIKGFCSIQDLSITLGTEGIHLVKGNNGSGKAQPLTEPVLTENGWKKMGELTLKDRVINPVDGKPIKILGITDRGSLPTYRVSFSDGTHTRCAGDHLWSVYTKKVKHHLRIFDTETLLKSYKRENPFKPGTFIYRYDIPITKSVDFGRTLDLPIHPYVLGFILGDGCITGGRPTVRVSTNLKDWKEVVSRLRQFLPNPNMVREGTEINGTIKHFRIHGLGEQLKELGLLGCRSNNKFIPDIYLNASIEDRKLLLAGLLDTDGSVKGVGRKKSKTSGYTSKSKKLRDGVVYLVRSLGGISKIRNCTRYKYGRWTKSFGCSIRLSYNPFIRKYKRENLGSGRTRNRMVLTIKDIQYIGERVSRCITVDSPDGLYITRDFIVTHNSSFLNAISWCLYGKTLKNIKDVNTLESWRPNDYKGTMVKIFFEKDGSIHQIIRCQEYKGKVEEAKGGNRLLYLIDGAQVKEKSKPKIQELIEKDLGSSFRLFKNTITFGQRLQRIAESSGPDKKALFEEAFEIGYITVAKNIAMVMKKETQQKYDEAYYRVKSITERYEDARKSYEKFRDSERNYKKIFREQVDQIENKITLRHEKLVKLEKKFDENLLTKSLKNLDHLKRELIKLKKEELNTNQQLTKITSKKGVLEFIESIMDLLQKGKYKVAYNDLKTLSSHFKSSEEIKDKKFKTQSKIYDVESFCREQEDIKDDITTLKGEITNLIKEKGNLRLERINIISPQYRKQRKELKAKLEKHRKNCETQKKALENLNWVINDPLSNSGMKTFIFDASLKSLNDCLDDYSSIIGFNIKFTVNTESSKRDFVTLIDKDGQLLQYEELSGGEQQLVNVAMAFALHSITSVSLGINLLFLDELFENLDKANIEIVMDLVKYIGNGKSIYIITHQENFSISGSNTIKVKKDNGITTIIP